MTTEEVIAVMNYVDAAVRYSTFPSHQAFRELDLRQDELLKLVKRNEVDTIGTFEGN